MSKLKEVLVAQAFGKVPGWWPRAYLALLLFGFFKESRYVVPAYELREKSRLVGIGRTTLYRGLDKLVSEGIVKKRDSIYMLTDKGVELLDRYRWLEEEIIRSVEENSEGGLISLLDEIKKLPESTEFEKYGKEYLNHLARLAIEVLRSVRVETTTQ